jgi:hypothetical protein
MKCVICDYPIEHPRQARSAVLVGVHGRKHLVTVCWLCLLIARLLLGNG